MRPKCAAMDTMFHLDRTLIRVSGPDAVGFLDNLLTQDVTRLTGASVQYAALLTPQGKVLADMALWSRGDQEVVIECAPTRGADLLRRLSLYKLRAAVTLEDVSEAETVCYSPEAFANARPDPRFPDGSLGWRTLIAAPDAAALDPGDAAYETHRLAMGVPDLARDTQADELFAGEALLEELHGVDFQKGCFVGQENVSRMKRRATTRKKLCRLAFSGQPIGYGAPITAGAAELGTVRTSADGRAMALLRLDRAMEAAAKGQSLEADGRPLRLDPPPWLILPATDAP